jgi:hypothetical protein
MQPHPRSFLVFLFLFISVNSVQSLSYHFIVQQPNCYIVENVTWVRVLYLMVVRCDEGRVNEINITMPYGEEEILETEGTPTAEGLQRGEPLPLRVHQTENATTMTISLQRALEKNDEYGIVLRYWIRDLPGYEGIIRPIRTLLDRLLGRPTTRFKITYKPTIFKIKVDNLNVRVFPPFEGDLFVKSWSPGRGKLAAGPGNPKESVYWSPVSINGGLGNIEFTVVIGRLSMLDTAHPLAIMLLFSILIVVSATLLAIVYYKISCK